MDTEGDVEQMGDYDGAGSASQNTGHLHMDSGLPHWRRGGTEDGRRLVKGQDDLMEGTEEAPPDECGCFPMRDLPAKVGQTSRWDLRTV